MPAGADGNATSSLASGRYRLFNQLGGDCGIIRQICISSQEFGNDLGWRGEQLASDENGLLLAIKITEPNLIIAFAPLHMKFGGDDCERLVAGSAFF